jgi:hypothetical protein
MRWLLVVALAACRSSEPTSAAGSAPPGEQVKPADDKATPTPTRPDDVATPAPKPPDDMDEKMRHCPLALDRATSTLTDIDGGVRFTVTVPDASLAELRRRAHHIVDFAARKTREGHGGFDGKGGGRMKNCPVVTDEVTIAASDIAGGAQLDITTNAAHVDALRSETRARVNKFPFVGATIRVATH